MGGVAHDQIVSIASNAPALRSPPHNFVQNATR